jgi:uncharacterized protein
MSDELGNALLVIARNAIGARFGEAPHHHTELADLAAPAATFVTLNRYGQLRGCIGSLQAWRPLADDVRENARAAAFRDPRFPPLSANELPQTRIEVSRLTAPEAFACSDEHDALKQLQAGVDGIILTAGERRATFLPQVWEELPEPREFLAHLKQKAGLPDGYWSDEVHLARYRVEKWQETGR